MKSIIILSLSMIVFYSAYGQTRKPTKEDILAFRFNETCLEGVCYQEMDDPDFRAFIVQKLSSKKGFERHRALELLSALRDSSALDLMSPFLYLENEKMVRIAIDKIAHVNSSESSLYLLQALNSSHSYDELQTLFGLINKLYNYPHRESVQPLLNFSCPNEVKWEKKWRDWMTSIAKEYGEILEIYFESPASRNSLLKEHVLSKSKRRSWAFRQIYRQTDKQFWISFLRENSPKDPSSDLDLLRARYILGDNDYTQAEQIWINRIKKSNLIRHNYE